MEYDLLTTMPSFAALTVCFLLQGPLPPTVVNGPTVALPPHRFFDTPNNALTAMESGALLWDGYTTLRTQHDFPGSREADPLARPFVNGGWPGQIAGGVLVVTADVGLRYWLHKRGHHRVERLLPLVLTTYGLVGGIYNSVTYNRAKRISR